MTAYTASVLLHVSSPPILCPFGLIFKWPLVFLSKAFEALVDLLSPVLREEVECTASFSVKAEHVQPATKLCLAGYSLHDG